MTDPSMVIFLYTFALAAIMGGVIAHSSFCTFGAIADWISFSDRGRLGAWVLAIGVSVIGVSILELTTQISTTESVFPYTSASFNPVRYMLGGLLFGFGMHLTGGCSSKALVRLGSGNIQALTVCCFAAIISYLLIYTTFYERLFHTPLAGFTLNLENFGLSSQRLAHVLNFHKVSAFARYLPILIGIIVSVYSLRLISKSARSSLVLSGVTVGLVVIAGWYLTGGPFGVAWVEHMSFEWHPPRNLGLQSFTFISPLADMLGIVVGREPSRSLTFGLISIFGLCFGSFVFHLLTGKLHLNPFKSLHDFLRAACGGVLLGVGGVLALGCSIGQGVTGLSTLAVGSMLATGSMCFGAALAIKIEFYRLMYPAEATWSSATLASLIDLRLLPKKWRKLDAV